MTRWLAICLMANSLLACTDARPPRSDPLHGETLFQIACAGCHRIDAGRLHDVGPNLYGIVGQPAASQEGYAYSLALQSSGLSWDRNSLAGWIAATEVLVPGTTMTYTNSLSGEEVAEVIDYLFETATNHSQRREP